MRRIRFAALLGAAAVAALPAAAHDFDFEEAQKDVAELTATEFEGANALPLSVTAVVGLLEELGYTDIEDFDVDRDEYEVEATNPEGIEVEIELDPVTGEILEVEED